MAECLRTGDEIAVSRSVMLCMICQGIIARIRSSPPGFYDGIQPSLFTYSPRQDTWRGAHHTENGTFALAVKDRCYICYTLHEACPKQARKYAHFMRTFYEIETRQGGQYLLRFLLELHPKPSSPGGPQLIETHGTFKLMPRDLLKNVAAPLGLTENTLSGKCATQVKGWLHDCREHHDACRKDWRTKLKYPARLLNVNPELGDQVRVEDEFQEHNHPLYVTMSHCWNHGPGIESTKLSAETEEGLHNGVKISTLPKKFRDAIKIARWMGINYLWIDALCIMQDSSDDWSRQSSIMGDIYAGSYCNIAATNADENMGCFRNRPVEIVEPYLIPNPRASSHEQEETYVVGYDDFWCSALFDTDLHRRAWVLQERLLSPRTIHFGKEQMFWECREYKACEAYPDGVPLEFSNRRTDAWRLGEQMFNPQSQKTATQSMFAKLISWFRTSDVLSSQQAYKFWTTAVEWYMDCKLSESSDKLVAIAGIANKVKETTGERYLAGLWENKDLARSLLWFVPVRDQADGSASVRSPSLGMPGYRAPSWSWASIEAKIKWDWPADSAEVLLSVGKTHIEAEGDDMSAIKSAVMYAKGQLVAVDLCIMHTDEDGRPKEDGSYMLTPRVSTTAVSASTSPASRSRCAEPVVYLDVPLAPLSKIEVYLLPVCRRHRDNHGHVDMEVSGLILRKVAQADTRYERIGVFSLDRSQAYIFEGGHPKKFEQILLI